MKICKSALACSNGRCAHKTPHAEGAGCCTPCDGDGVKDATCVDVSDIPNAETQQTTTESLTTERGKNYGDPASHFAATRGMSGVWGNRRFDAIEKGAEIVANEDALHQAVYMICDKLARAANNPMHKDNWDDVAGYALCAKRVLGLEK